jgi:hypothetical protein
VIDRERAENDVRRNLQKAAKRARLCRWATICELPALVFIGGLYWLSLPPAETLRALPEASAAPPGAPAPFHHGTRRILLG